MFHYFAQGDYIECKSLIGEIQSKYPEKNETAFHVRGLIARNEGDLDEAMECFHKAYEVSGKNKNVPIAVEQLKKASEVMKDNPKVWFWLAKAIYHFPAEKMQQGKTFNPVEAARTVLMK
uniref:TPR_REGION domain-containing protein n=1 Tax=Caenorhabditis japonica TaxID=281687 RepID=A0A8R1EMA1_CAEJA